MSEALAPAVEPREIERRGAVAVALPAVIVDAGPAAVERFLEFFAAAIANDRTRMAYGRAAGQFLAWCGARGLGLRAITPLHVAAYIRTHPGSVPTVKQHLAAIRTLCDWLVVHQVLPSNPAASVRGPKHVVTKGSTPVLTPAETRALLDRIDTGTVVGLRDRALLSVLMYSFAGVSAAVGMRRQDYFLQGTRGWLRLHEKGGKRHDVPAHHRARPPSMRIWSPAGSRTRRRRCSERRPVAPPERPVADAAAEAAVDAWIEAHCPIPGCQKLEPFMSRGGWDTHVASLQQHPDWHPDVKDREKRKRFFRAGVPRLEHWCTGGSPVTLKRPEGRATGYQIGVRHSGRHAGDDQQRRVLQRVLPELVEGRVEVRALPLCTPRQSGGASRHRPNRHRRCAG